MEAEIKDLRKILGRATKHTLRSGCGMLNDLVGKPELPAQFSPQFDKNGEPFATKHQIDIIVRKEGTVVKEASHPLRRVKKTLKNTKKFVANFETCTNK